MQSERRDGPPGANRPISELFKDLANETSTLVRQEIQLARAEMTQQAGALKEPAADLVLLLALLLGAFGAVTAAAIAAIALALPVWAAALLVAAVYALAGFALSQRAKSGLRRAAKRAPKKTIESLRKDLEAVRAGVRQAR